MCKEMKRLRELLTAEGIAWEDKSDTGAFSINRTHFWHNGYHWSVIHGHGTYGKEEGKLELMTGAVNGGEPVGYLTAERIMKYIQKSNALVKICNKE